MIRTVAELLSQIVQQELQLLDASEIKHAPTIGDMYEGLSADLLGRAIPEGLGLQIVAGFATDGAGNQSGQLDCMLVRGEGNQIPYTDSVVWHVKDIIAVIEVKKTLHSAEMSDAWKQLLSIRTLEANHAKIAAAKAPNEAVDIRLASRAFAETTGLIAPAYEDLDDLPFGDQMIFQTLVSEQTSIIRIVLGLHGFKSELAFRRALVSILQANIGVSGFGPGGFPQLIISGNFSLAKANGRPYSAPLVDGMWPFYFSTPINPLLLLLEFIWTRLDELFDVPDLWGDDLNIEVMRPLLTANATQDGGRSGWNILFVDPSESDLSSIPTEEAWSPAFLSLEEFTILQQLCAGRTVSMDDAELLVWLRDREIQPDSVRESLVKTGLVAMQGRELRLITSDCLSAILPTGEYVAAENNTGRLTRWLATQRASVSRRPSN